MSSLPSANGKPIMRRAHRLPSAWSGTTILLLSFLALVAVISPFHNTPVQDDWDYARTVSIFLKTGVFERSELVQATEVFTTLWGALFSRWLGFSFITLRLSTLTLSGLTVLLFFAILGEIGFDIPRRVIGAATLMVSPLFVYLSFSFMTDVPALFWELGALYLFLAALRREDARLALVASVCAAVAFLTRQIGLMTAIAAGAYFLFHAPRGRRRAFAVASAALPTLVFALYTGWAALGHSNWAASEATLRGTLAFLLDAQMPGTVARRGVVYFMTLAFYLAPLWLAAPAALVPAFRSMRQATRTDLALALLTALGFAAVILRLAISNQWWPYLADTFTRQGLRPYLAYFAYEAGSRRPDVLPLPNWIALTVFAGLLGWALTFIALKNILRPSRLSPALQLIYWMGFCLGLPTLFFNGFFERYALPFLPLAIIVLLEATRSLRPSLKLASFGLVAMAVLSIALMKDFWGWMDNRWIAAEGLVHQGIPLEEIDGGYEWDGWNLYDESMAYVRRSRVPITFNPWEYILDPEYMITFTGLPGYHVQEEIDFNSPFGPALGRIFILKRDALPGF